MKTIYKFVIGYILLIILLIISYISYISETFDAYLVLLGIIFGPTIALLKYDRTLFNKKQYEVWKEVWEIKTDIFKKMIAEQYVMSKIVSDLHELCSTNIKNPKGRDCLLLFNWIKLLEGRDGQEFIPVEIKSELKELASKSEKLIDREQFEFLYRNVLEFRRFRANDAFYKIDQLKGNVNLYIRNAKMLQDFSNITSYVYNECFKDYISEDDFNKFAESFPKKMRAVIKQMKQELQDDLNSNKVTLILEKSSLD